MTTGVPAKISRLQRYDTGADEESRSKVLAAVESFPADQQLAAAVSFTLIALRAMRDSAMSPIQREICQEHIDILTPLIPAEIHAAFERARK